MDREVIHKPTGHTNTERSYLDSSKEEPERPYRIQRGSPESWDQARTECIKALDREPRARIDYLRGWRDAVRGLASAPHGEERGKLACRLEPVRPVFEPYTVAYRDACMVVLAGRDPTWSIRRKGI